MNQREIAVVAYNPGWTSLFAAERARLAQALGEAAISIHHIGSTSVTGLAAKPILDILIEAASLSAMDEKAREMEALGYEVRGENGIPNRRYYQKGGAQRTHHVHAFATGDENLIRHLAFRDYLRQHPEAAAEYARLKQTLASRFKNDPQAYQAGKNDFIEMHQKLALAWYTNR